MSQVWSVRGQGTEIELRTLTCQNYLMVEGNEEEKDSGWEKCHDICVIWYWICKFEWSTIRNFNFKLDIYIGFKPDLFFHNKIRN